MSIFNRHPPQPLAPVDSPTFVGLTLSSLGAGAVMASSVGRLSSTPSPTLSGLTLSGLDSGDVKAVSGILSTVPTPSTFTVTFRLNDGPEGVILDGAAMKRGAGNNSVALIHNYPGLSDDGRTIDIECKVSSGTLQLISTRNRPRSLCTIELPIPITTPIS